MGHGPSPARRPAPRRVDDSVLWMRMAVVLAMVAAIAVILETLLPSGYSACIQVQIPDTCHHGLRE